MSTAKKARDAMRPKIDKLMRAFALDVTTKITRRTPVDKGTLKLNWNASVGRPDPSTRPDGTSAAQPLKDAQNKRTLTTWSASSGTPAFLTNAMPYAAVIEEGYSKKAPKGMVGITVAEMRPVLRRIARQTRNI